MTTFGGVLINETIGMLNRHITVEVHFKLIEVKKKVALVVELMVPMNLK